MCRVEIRSLLDHVPMIYLGEYSQHQHTVYDWSVPKGKHFSINMQQCSKKTTIEQQFKMFIARKRI